MDPVAHQSELSRIRRAYSQRATLCVGRRYSIAERGNVLRTEELLHRMLRLIANRFGTELPGKRVLEIGCGSGYWLRQLIQWGARPANLVGVDLVPENIIAAKELCPSGVCLECADASKLAYDDGSFDLVVQFTALTSVLDPFLKKTIATEMLRVLKPNGCVLWYDFFFNNPANRDVRGISKKEIWQLFPGCRVLMERLSLAPPLGRVLGKISRRLYRAISATKILCTHYLGFIDKGSCRAVK